MRARGSGRAGGLGESFDSVLAAARTGAPWAFERLWQALAPSVSGYLHVQGALEPDDLVSEVFLSAFTGLESFEGGEDRFRSWLFTIAHHRLVDDWRRRGRRVRRMCDLLAPDQRDVALLRMVAGLSVDQTADALGKTTIAVKALQHRAVAALRRNLDREGIPVSGRDDHHVEMPTPALDENMAEAFLSGRPVGAEELGPLTAFAEDLRVTVDRPVPVPNAALATLLIDGIPTPTGAAAVSSSTRSAEAADSRNRRKLVSIRQLLAALAAKLTGLGMASKAALGLGVAAASVSTAGVAGILPDPAHDAVATVISATTPFELPDSGDGGTDGSGVDDTDGVTDDADVPDADGAENHGACVSEIAKNAPKGPNGEHGKAVSTAARSDCGKDPSTSTTTSSSSSTSTSSTTSTTLDDASIEDNRGRGGPGSNGGGGNSGPGSSGNGNSGNGNSGPGNSGSGGGQGPGRSGKAG